MRRRLLYLALIVVVLLLLLLGGARWWVGRAFPQIDGTLALAGLDGEVEIRRDEWGVPHIYASTLHDAFFAQGVVHAQDRLWQMDFQRRVGLGQLSEMLGDAAVDTDRFLRTIGTHRAAQQDWEAVTGDARVALEAYAEGVNAYLATDPPLPLEYTLLQLDEVAPWEPVHSLAWAKMMQWDLSDNWSEELLRLRMSAALGAETTARLLQDGTIVGSNELPMLTDSATSLTLPRWLQGGARRERGSNAWAISADRTASGRPILENDPHMTPAMPSPWYLVGLHAPGLEVAGGSLPGTPAVVIGHNADVAWGVTTLYIDSQDLFVERLSDDGTAYEFQGEMRPVVERTETINIKGGEPLTFTVRETQHGPLINEVVDGLQQPVAFQWWATQQPTHLFQAVMGLQQATSTDVALSALEMWDSPPQNIMLADRQGRIAFQAAGALPIRPAGGGVLPQPGWTGEWEWQGTVPYDEMPRLVDPPEGYLVTANDNPFPADFPYYTGTGWAAPFRRDRIRTMIDSFGNEITLEQMRQIQADLTSRPAEQLVPYFLDVTVDDEIVRRAQEQLGEWNFTLDPELPAAGIYELLYGFTLRNLLADDFGDDRPAADAFGLGQRRDATLEPTLLDDYLGYYQDHARLLLSLMERPNDPLWDDGGTTEVEDRDAILRRAWLETTDWLGRQFGDVPHEWFWKRLHPLTFGHPMGSVDALAPLLNRTVAVGGDRSTPNANGFTYGADGFVVDNTPSLRFIADVGGWEKSQILHTTGQSGQPFHPHYDDMIAPWSRVELAPLGWSDAQTQAAAQGRTLRLRPADGE
ncbi:MAG: penicillin acylase family protein [Anaerolineales bacterium]|nr:penicillin acylase family protein [Anaerolineales bacterium]MCB9128372.1 penicillin acylase family protein [Ardenticatenales bacterium]MCB9172184.1 penicillin acylase family protein [Ardenticatenales bacterium]